MKRTHDSRTTERLPSELALIRDLRHRAATAGRSLLTGIGDDCAVLRPRPGYDLCVTTDFSLEGVHFRRDWHPPQSAGHRCLARGLSDLAAMGAEPLAVFLSLALPARLPREWFEQFMDGFLTLARQHRVPLAGGDTAQAPGSGSNAKILADIVALGQLPRHTARLRSTAQPGDLLYVTGALGGSAAELLALSDRTAGTLSSASVLKGHGLSRAVRKEKKMRASAPEGAHPHLYPQPRLAAGRRLRPLVHAIIDISDGLSTDLMHLCEESGVSAELDEAALPIHPLALDPTAENFVALKRHDLTAIGKTEFFEGARLQPCHKGRKVNPALAAEECLSQKSGRISPLDLALHGGEDYELLFTAAPSAKIPRSIAGVPIHRIGSLRKPARHQARILLKTHDGRLVPLQPAGWEHFR